MIERCNTVAAAQLNDWLPRWSGDGTEETVMSNRTLSRLSRVAWTIGYVLFVVAGVSGLITPSRAVSANIAEIGIWVWSSFFIFGGLFCLASSVFKQWWGELTGLPLITSAAAIYGAAVLAQWFNPQTRDGAYLFVGALLLAFAFKVFARWMATLLNFRVAMRVNNDAV